MNAWSKPSPISLNFSFSTTISSASISIVIRSVRPLLRGMVCSESRVFRADCRVRSNVKLNCLVKYYIRSFADRRWDSEPIIWVSGSMGMRSDCSVKMNEIDVLWASKWRNCNVKWVSSWSIKCFLQDALALKFRAHNERHLNLFN